MENSEKRERLQIIARTKHSDNEEAEDDSMDENETKLDYSELAKTVLELNVNVIGTGLHAFFEANQTKLRKAIVGKGQRPLAG
jgi:hypothetical protein